MSALEPRCAADGRITVHVSFPRPVAMVHSHAPPFIHLITPRRNGRSPSQVPSAVLIMPGGGLVEIRSSVVFARRDLSAPPPSHLINILGDESVTVLINNS